MHVRSRTHLPSITQPIPQQITLYKKALMHNPNHEHAAENLKIDEQHFVERGQPIPGTTNPLGYAPPPPRSPKAPPKLPTCALPTLASRQSSPLRDIPTHRVKKVSNSHARGSEAGFAVRALRALPRPSV